MSERSNNQWNRLNETMARTDTASKQQNFANLVVWLTLGVFLALGPVFYRGCIYESPGERAAKQAKLNAGYCTNKIAAYDKAQEFVQEQLKSPSTAEFPSSFSNDYAVEIQPGGATVVGHVDAHNSLGAMIRSNFAVELSCDRSTSKWTLSDLVIE